ncbi:MAG: hypothetical protein II971_04460 [Firmicutes bacterium]|nr:hypothetical protein [Bacillota bacterium]
MSDNGYEALNSELFFEHVLAAASDPACPYVYTEPPPGTVSFSELLSCGEEAVLGDLRLAIKALRLIAEACVMLSDRLIFPGMLSMRLDDIRFDEEGRQACLRPLPAAFPAQSDDASCGAGALPVPEASSSFSDGIFALLFELERRFPSARAEEISEALSLSKGSRRDLDERTLLRLLSLMEIELSQ